MARPLPKGCGIAGNFMQASPDKNCAAADDAAARISHSIL
jgi:hypothetical protein